MRSKEFSRSAGQGKGEAARTPCLWQMWQALALELPRGLSDLRAPGGNVAGLFGRFRQRLKAKSPKCCKRLAPSKGHQLHLLSEVRAGRMVSKPTGVQVNVTPSVRTRTPSEEAPSGAS